MLIEYKHYFTGDTMEDEYIQHVLSEYCPLQYNLYIDMLETFKKNDKLFEFTNKLSMIIAAEAEISKENIPVYIQMAFKEVLYTLFVDLSMLVDVDDIIISKLYSIYKAIEVLIDTRSVELLGIMEDETIEPVDKLYTMLNNIDSTIDIVQIYSLVTYIDSFMDTLKDGIDSTGQLDFTDDVKVNLTLDKLGIDHSIDDTVIDNITSVTTMVQYIVSNVLRDNISKVFDKDDLNDLINVEKYIGHTRSYDILNKVTIGIDTLVSILPDDWFTVINIEE